MSSISPAERSKRWREAHRERFNAYQRAWKRRKRSKPLIPHQLPAVPGLPLAPEGWEGDEISGSIADFCRRRGIPNDPRFW